MSVSPAERHTDVDGHHVRSVHFLPSPGDDPDAGSGAERDPDVGWVVVLPGLGLPAYVEPTARALAAGGIECVVLDIPGFGCSGALCADPHVDSMAEVAAGWLLSTPPERPAVILGHSTGAQAALGAALMLQRRRQRFALVMAGPTFAPQHRSIPRLLAAVPRAYRRDTPREIDVPAVLRARLDLARLARSGMHDAPEERVAELRAPLTVTAGRLDAFAPRTWLDQLADAAGQAAVVRNVVAGGSHNNLYSHPEALARVAKAALEDARHW